MTHWNRLDIKIATGKTLTKCGSLGVHNAIHIHVTIDFIYWYVTFFAHTFCLWIMNNWNSLDLAIRTGAFYHKCPDSILMCNLSGLIRICQLQTPQLMLTGYYPPPSFFCLLASWSITLMLTTRHASADDRWNFLKVKIIEFHNHIRNHHEKCIQISTNMPGMPGNSWNSRSNVQKCEKASTFWRRSIFANLFKQYYNDRKKYFCACVHWSTLSTGHKRMSWLRDTSPMLV